MDTADTMKWTLEAEVEVKITDVNDVIQPDEIARLIRAAMPDGITIPSIKMHREEFNPTTNPIKPIHVIGKVNDEQVS